MNAFDSTISVGGGQNQSVDAHNLRKFVEFLGKQNINFHENALLSEYTTFRLGGRTPSVVKCETPESVIDTVSELNRLDMGFELIGEGSNLLVSDHGVPTVVVCYSGSPSIDREGRFLTVTGSTRLDELVKYTIDEGLGGFVNCSGIPGTVGGAIAGNAGAFGWQIADCLSTLKLITRKGEVRTSTVDALEFGYRYSELQKSREIILSARFELLSCNREVLRTERERIIALRSSKHPDLSVDSCAGSFFKNIEPTSAAERRQAAGWILDRAGASTMVVGGAGVYKKHANIIIKKNPECSAQDVYKLSVMLSEKVNRKFGIQLRREVKLLGEF